MDFSSLYHLERIIRENIDLKTKLERKYELIDDLDKNIYYLKNENLELRDNYNKQVDLSDNFIKINADLQTLIESKDSQIELLNSSIEKLNKCIIDYECSNNNNSGSQPPLHYNYNIETINSFIIGILCIMFIMFMLYQY